jgi:hypothetical protein
MQRSSATDVSARVDGLIERFHGGDQRLAARRLGIDPKLLAGLLSGDWRHFSLDALAAVIRTHGVSIDWLLGSPGGLLDRMAPNDRIIDVPTAYFEHGAERPGRIQ